MLIEELAAIHAGRTEPLILRNGEALRFDDVRAADDIDLSPVEPGDVVALVGDFTPSTINALLRLIERQAIVVPLSPDTSASFPYYFEQAGVNVVVRDGTATRIRADRMPHPMLQALRLRRHPGLILFSSGTTGQPKAILHDFESFLARFRTPRPALRTLNFLLFDHVGGLNTLFHTMFNGGQVVIPSGRTPEKVVEDIARHGTELLPTTPTFLRMLLLSGLIAERPDALASLRIVTYGTEPMDEDTLRQLCAALPHVDFRQTYGMSELGILRIRSRARDSLWMEVGGEGVQTRVTEAGVLQILSANRMEGYLNAPDPFTDGWYDTGDVVETDGKWLRIVGRSKLIINVGGLKILPGEIERVALLHPAVELAKAEGVKNPITGQHVEVTCQLRPGADADRATLRKHFAAHLPAAVRPHRIAVGQVAVNHRFKRA